MKTFRHISVIFAFMIAYLLPAAGLNAASRSFPRLSFGIEGSLAGTFLSYRHSNYISNYGYRIDRRVINKKYHTNGEILLHLGMNISRHVNLSLYSGYSGVCKNGSIYPLSLRCTWFPAQDPSKDRWFAFIDGGPALKKTGRVSSLAGTGKLGCGYRISLTRSAKMDFLFSLRQAFIKDIYSQPGMLSAEYVEKDRIRRNNAAYMAVTLGIGLTF